MDQDEAWKRFEARYMAWTAVFVIGGFVLFAPWCLYMLATTPAHP